LGWVGLFYSGLIGSKIVIAWGVARGSTRLDSRGYRVALATTGAALVALGLVLLVDGGRRLAQFL
ncbi:MAG: hypothetical protein AAF772_21440, partial [Acidobacteriota bacterium]